MQDILHIFRCYFVQQITFFSKLRLINNFAQLTYFLLHFSTLTQQLYLSKVDVFERSFENLKFSIQVLKTILKDTCCQNMPINLLSIQVFGSGGSPQLQSKSVTPSASTQYVYPSSRYDGLSYVTVNGDSNLKAANIKSGTSIFGVTGSYSASPTMINFRPSEYNDDQSFFYTESSSPIFFSSSYAPIYYWEFNYNIEINNKNIYCIDFSSFFNLVNPYLGSYCYENFDSFKYSKSTYEANYIEDFFIYSSSGYIKFASSARKRIWWRIDFTNKKFRIEISKSAYGEYISDSGSSSISWSFNIIQ